MVRVRQPETPAIAVMVGLRLATIHTGGLHRLPLCHGLSPHPALLVQHMLRYRRGLILRPLQSCLELLHVRRHAFMPIERRNRRPVQWDHPALRRLRPTEYLLPRALRQIGIVTPQNDAVQAPWCAPLAFLKGPKLRVLEGLLLLAHRPDEQREEPRGLLA